MFNTGHVKDAAWWAELEEDIRCLYFEDKEQCYRQFSSMDEFYVPENSSIWQMHGRDCPRWLRQVVNALPSKMSLAEDMYCQSVVRLDPGNTVPEHIDEHFLLRKRYGIEDDTPTWRYLIFLEDWQSGHYFEIDGNPITKWRAGDWICFSRDTYHLAGNNGTTPFFSAQVTFFGDK